MRNLASVVTIKAVKPIKGKDRIQIAQFKEIGYEAIVGKNLNPGDIVAFIQEGSILPNEPTWEFLRSRCWKASVNGFVIKPMTMSGVQSWGLTLELHELGLEKDVYSKFKPGQDLTELLKIRKMDDEEAPSTKMTFWQKLFSKFLKNKSTVFPSFIISKSDETTIQNMPEALEKFADDEVYVTAKIEGSSTTAVLDKKDFYMCSRNLALRVPNNDAPWKMARKMNLKSKMKKYAKRFGYTKLAVQGELAGPGIQKNIYCFKDFKFFVYSIKVEKDGVLRQLNIEEMMSAACDMGLRTVPFVASFILKDQMPTVEAAVDWASKIYWRPETLVVREKGLIMGCKLWEGYFQHEGVVVRSKNYDKDNGIGTSFKIKNMAYAEQKLGDIHQKCFDYIQRHDLEDRLR